MTGRGAHCTRAHIRAIHNGESPSESGVEQNREWGGESETAGLMRRVRVARVVLKKLIEQVLNGSIFRRIGDQR